MLGEILLSRPKIAVRRGDDATACKGQQEAGGIGISGNVARGNNVIVFGNPEHPFVKSPMAELAKCHAVTDVVVLAYAPWNNMGGIYDGMLFRRDNSHSA